MESTVGRRLDKDDAMEAVVRGMAHHVRVVVGLEAGEHHGSYLTVPCPRLPPRSAS